MPSISYANGQLISSVTGVSYQWYLNGNPIAGANQISYTPTQQGNYTVEVFFQDACSKTSLPYNFISTGVSDWKNEDFKIYPNPSSNAVTIEGLGNQSVELRSMSGQLIHLNFVQQNKLDISHLSTGCYILSIEGRHYKIQKL